MRVIDTDYGRAIEHEGFTKPLPPMAVDAKVHGWITPDTLWVSVQRPGEPRDVYPGGDGQYLGSLDIEADPELAAAAEREQRIETLRDAIETQRKQAEAVGVTHEGMRFSGSPANRQYLSEALQFAQAVGVDTFDTWKDSDNHFHANVPVATVTEAFQQIGLRRDALFKREQQYAEQIEAGELLSAEGLDWAL